MATVLLILIFVDYIGLGIPDPVFGAGWPAIYRDLGLMVSDANYVTLLTSFLGMVSSLASARLINRFGCSRVTMVSTLMTAVGLLGCSVSGSLWWFCLCAIPLGLGAGAIDSGLNNYVALHYSARSMNFLHCAYGVGVALSPYLMSFALGQGFGWRGGYQLATAVQTVIALLTVLCLPIWNRVHPAEAASEEDAPRTLTIRQLLAMPRVRLVCCLFVASCSIELTCGTWSSTFLVDARGAEVEMGALGITVYYVGFTLGRFVAGLLVKRLTSWQLVFSGLGLQLVGIVLLFLPLPAAAVLAVLFVLGLGVGPVFPNMNQLTPVIFGRSISQSVMGIQMAAGYAGIMLAPTLFGILAQALSPAIMPTFLLVFFAILLLAALRLRAMKPYEENAQRA